MFRIQDLDDNKRPNIDIKWLPTNLLLEVTVVSPLYSDLSIPQSKIQGRAAARAVITKNNKYETATTSEVTNLYLLHLRNEDYGPKNKDFFSLVIKHGSQQNNIKPAILMWYLMRRISLSLLKFSARSIITRQSRIQSPNNYHDESNYLDAINSQSTLFSQSAHFSSLQFW